MKRIWILAIVFVLSFSQSLLAQRTIRIDSDTWDESAQEALENALEELERAFDKVDFKKNISQKRNGKSYESLRRVSRVERT